MSDMQGPAIYRFAYGHIEQWFAGDRHRFCAPNGLLAGSAYLIVGCWNRVVDEFETLEDGHLMRIRYADRAVDSIGTGVPNGHIDGLEADAKGGYLVTDWLAGKLLRVNADGPVDWSAGLEHGCADHDLVVSEDLVVIPFMLNNTVRAFRVPD